jgi:periplasmic divalent cation tolerance protein
MCDFLSVHITTSSHAEAEKIAHALINEKMAACVHILPPIRSIYRWEGKVEETEETLLMVKTRLPLFEPLQKLVKALHSYSCPCIVATPITAGHPPYLDWLTKETTA